MTGTISTTAIGAVITAIAITILSYIRLGWLIQDKIKRNHFKNRMWHPILHALFVVFMIDGVTLIADMVHQIIHSMDLAITWWFLPAYLIRMGAIIWLSFVLKWYSGAFDEDTKIGE